MPKTFRFNVSFATKVVLTDEDVVGFEALRKDVQDNPQEYPAVLVNLEYHTTALPLEEFLEALLRTNYREAIKAQGAKEKFGKGTVVSPAKVTRLDTPPVAHESCQAHQETCADPRCTAH